VNMQENHQGAPVDWLEECPVSITVCDTGGIIVQMNQVAAESYRQWGGRQLIGTSMLDCHPELALTKLQELMDRQQRNVYTIEKNGIRKMILQTPWYQDGRYSGFVEMSFQIPLEVPHFIREG
jgi:hypothetical protein